MIRPSSLLRSWGTSADKALGVFVTLSLVGSAVAISMLPEPPQELVAESEAVHMQPCSLDRPDPTRYASEPEPIEWPLRPLTEEERAIPPNAVVSSSGVASAIMRHGDENLGSPSVHDAVSVYQLGWTMEDGNPLDGMRSLPVSPTRFELDEVIVGYASTVSEMHPGERRRFWVPAELAYGNKATGPRGTLIFDVELVSFDH